MRFSVSSKSRGVVITENALALIESPPLTNEIVLAAQAQLEINYGTQYDPHKITQLALMMIEEGWSVERFKLTLKWFLKNKPFPAWTISDWFSYKAEIHNYAWYLQQVHEFGESVNAQIRFYHVASDVTGYSYEQDLPFEKRW